MNTLLKLPESEPPTITNSPVSSSSSNKKLSMKKPASTPVKSGLPISSASSGAIKKGRGGVVTIPVSGFKTKSAGVNVKSKNGSRLLPCSSV